MPVRPTSAGGQGSEPGRNEVTQPPGDAVADHRVADGLAHHKTRPGRRRGRRRPRRVRGQRVDDEAAPPALDRDGEPRGSPRSAADVRQPAARRAPTSRIRPTARRGPCDGGPPGWPGRRGSACAGGTRGSSRGGGCSAGRFAYPCSLLLLCARVGREERSLRLACRAGARQSLVSPTNVWPRHDERRQRGHAKSTRSHAGDLTRVRTPVGRPVSTPSATVRDRPAGRDLDAAAPNGNRRTP